ncbi:hypothetical protein BC834DRAFT_312119, partial [Gloeopeniophorella convolvens]
MDVQRTRTRGTHQLAPARATGGDLPPFHWPSQSQTQHNAPRHRSLLPSSPHHATSRPHAWHNQAASARVPPFPSFAWVMTAQANPPVPATPSVTHTTHRRAPFCASTGAGAGARAVHGDGGLPQRRAHGAVGVVARGRQ